MVHFEFLGVLCAFAVESACTFGSGCSRTVRKAGEDKDEHGMPEFAQKINCIHAQKQLTSFRLECKIIALYSPGFVQLRFVTPFRGAVFIAATRVSTAIQNHTRQQKILVLPKGRNIHIACAPF